jgi:hypothetical protein
VIAQEKTMTSRRRIRTTTTVLVVLILGSLFALPLSAAPGGYASFNFIPGPDYVQSDTRALFRIVSDTWGLPMHRVDWLNPQGTGAKCHPSGGGCTTHNEYSVQGTLLATTWEFWILGQQRPSGTYTAVVMSCTSSSFNYCTGSWIEVYRANFYIRDESVTFALAGNAGAAGATLSYVDGTGRTVLADGTGNYTIRVPSGWSGTVTPAKTNYFFSPASRTYGDVMADQAAQDYTGFAITSRIRLPLVLR